jgi:hypothetical protein
LNSNVSRVSVMGDSEYNSVAFPFTFCFVFFFTNRYWHSASSAVVLAADSALDSPTVSCFWGK